MATGMFVMGGHGGDSCIALEASEEITFGVDGGITLGAGGRDSIGPGKVVLIRVCCLGGGVVCDSLGGKSTHLWKNSLRFEMAMSWEFEALSVASWIVVERKLMA